MLSAIYKITDQADQMANHTWHVFPPPQTVNKILDSTLSKNIDGLLVGYDL